MYAIKYKITQDDIALATKLAPTRAYNEYSITKGQRNVVGVLGEICYVKMMSYLLPRKEIDYTPSYDYDVLIGGYKVDVKTKQRTVAPQSSYAASIAAYSKDLQMCDYYAFTSITVARDNKDDFLDFYFIGNMSKSKYFSLAEFKRKGDSDGDNFVATKGKTFTIVEDCYNLEYKSLYHTKPEHIEILEEKGLSRYKL